MPSRSTRTTGIVLAIVGLVAVVVAIVLLVRPSGGSQAPAATSSASPSSSAGQEDSAAPTTSTAPEQSADTPADSPGPADPAAPAATAAPATADSGPSAVLAVDAFSASPSTVACEGDRTAVRSVSLSWSTSGGTAARLAAGTTDAGAGDPVELSASGYALTVACRDSETLVALTVEGADGSTAQRTLVVTAED